MRDITYCIASDCPSRDCKIKVTNNKFQHGEIVSMADFSGVCRYYIGWLIDEIDDTGDWCEWETDYISRMEAIKNVIDQLRVSSSEECLRERLLNLRPADVREVVRGKWILKDDGRAHCSMCDTPGNSHVWNFCPNCGAKMEES